MLQWKKNKTMKKNFFSYLLYLPIQNIQGRGYSKQTLFKDGPIIRQQNQSYPMYQAQFLWNWLLMNHTTL